MNYISASLPKYQKFHEQRSIKHELWESSDKLKSIVTLYFENTMYRVLH